MPISQVSPEWNIIKKPSGTHSRHALHEMHFHTVKFYTCSGPPAVGLLQFVAVNLPDTTAGPRDKVIRFSLTLFKCGDLWKINRRNLLTRPSRASNGRHQSFCTVPTRGWFVFSARLCEANRQKILEASRGYRGFPHQFSDNCGWIFHTRLCG